MQIKAIRKEYQWSSLKFWVAPLDNMRFEAYSPFKRNTDGMVGFYASEVGKRYDHGNVEYLYYSDEGQYWEIIE